MCATRASTSADRCSSTSSDCDSPETSSLRRRRLRRADSLFCFLRIAGLSSSGAPRTLSGSGLVSGAGPGEPAGGGEPDGGEAVGPVLGDGMAGAGMAETGIGDEETVAGRGAVGGRESGSGAGDGAEDWRKGAVCSWSVVSSEFWLYVSMSMRCSDLFVEVFTTMLTRVDAAGDEDRPQGLE